MVSGRLQDSAHCMEMKAKFLPQAVLEVHLWFGISFKHPQMHKWSNVSLMSDGTEFCYKEFRLELVVAFHYLEINLNLVGSFSGG